MMKLVNCIAALILLALSWVFPALQPLPDPLTGPDGRRIATAAAWEGRRGEIAALLEEYVYGPRPDYTLEISQVRSDYIANFYPFHGPASLHRRCVT